MFLLPVRLGITVECSPGLRAGFLREDTLGSAGFSAGMAICD